MYGMDLSNLNAWRFFYDIICEDEAGNICTPLNPFLVGDTLFHDFNNNSQQDEGEPGIPGVTVNLLDSNGFVLATTTTADDGSYSFPVDGKYVDPDINETIIDGIYTVQVAPENFAAGGPLAGAVSTTGGEQQTNTVIDDNVMTYDFGYTGTGAIGDFVWLDLNANGLQDDSFGLADVKVTLELDLNNDGVIDYTTSTVTNSSGFYSFTNLPAGAYTISIDPTTLPAGLIPSYDLDGIASAHTAQVTLAAGESNANLDFGYTGTAAIGDTLWLDINANGQQDDGLGLANVKVDLAVDLNGDGATDFTTSTVTDENGLYNFPNLPAGAYTISVDPTGLPGGLIPSFDLDGTATPNTAQVTLASGETNLDLDFGYKGTGSIGDYVWKDLNGNSLQDDGTGLANVKVILSVDLNGDGTSDYVTFDLTDPLGYYSFTNLPAGTYTVSLDPTTLPGGLIPSFDLDGIATANIAQVTLGAGESNANLDFGYKPAAISSIGDTIWRDSDADGKFEPEIGEIGLANVKVTLTADYNNDGTVDFTASTFTDAKGFYRFSNLPEGIYTVSVDPTSLPANHVPTYDLDGTGTAHKAIVNLPYGAAKVDVDFGYRPNVSPGTGTIGYWKNHAEAWPVETITIGGVTYTKAQAINIMNTNGKGDKTYDMFNQLVAAKLNVGIGNECACVNQTIRDADAWLAKYPLGSNQKGGSQAWKEGEALHTRLDQYNNGKLCAPHRG